MLKKFDSKKFRGRKFKLGSQLKCFKNGLDSIKWITRDYSPKPGQEVNDELLEYPVQAVLNGAQESCIYWVYKLVKDLPQEEKPFLLSYGYMWMKLLKWAERNMRHGPKW